MIKKMAPLLFVLIFNLWIWKIFSFSVLAGIIVLAASVSLWLSVIYFKGRKYFLITLCIFAVLLFFQYKVSYKTPLTFLNDDEKIHQLERLRAYPPVGINIAGKRVWIPISNWLEQRKETVVFYRFQGNFSEIIDPNLYFYANHPRERVGATEFEKFPFILLPFFVIGLLSITKSTSKSFLLGVSPLVLGTIIGNSSPGGPFALFPFIAVSIGLGLIPVFSKKEYLIPGVFLYILVFIQVLSYAKY